MKLGNAETATGHATPIVKWAGGKTRLLPELVARMPKRYGRYFEPFAGGAALFFHLAPERAVLSDLNHDLIAMYRHIASDPGRVIGLLKQHQKQHDQFYYRAVRARWNDGRMSWKPAARAAAFIYLNKTCFNGLWRVNRNGQFNVPMGRYANPRICDPDAIRAASTLLSKASVACDHYADTVKHASKGDFVYFDSPYAPVSSSANFTTYTRTPFGDKEQEQLATCARSLVARGCHVMLSNSDVPMIRSLYKGFKISRVRCNRSINSDANKRGPVWELIITNRS